MIFFEIDQFKNNLKPNFRLLGLDVGQVRIGCALSDQHKILASPYKLFNLKKQKFTLADLNIILDKESAYGIVVGYPLQMDGIAGNSCLMVDKFIKKYLLPLKQPIYLQDERLSSAAVSRYLQEMELTRKQQLEVNDKAAASYILQTALDKLKHIGIGQY